MPGEASEFQKVVIFGVLGTIVNPHSIFVEIDFLCAFVPYLAMVPPGAGATAEGP